MGYVWCVDGQGVQLRVDYLSGRGEELHGEIAVTLRGNHLHMARFNLSSSTARGTLRKALEEQTEGLDIPWKKLVEQFCVAVLRREREGSPTQHTSQTQRKPISYLVDRLVMRNKTNSLFAPGGSGKGMLCVGLCCAVAARRGLGELSVMPATPFYFDWEDDFDTFQERLNVIANGMRVPVPSIAYRRMRGLLSDRINEMARALSDEGADFAIVDSFSAAGGTVSERTSWDTIAHRLFDAIDQVPNVTWLIIDHVTGGDRKDPSGKAFGSIQKMNRVRNSWEMRSEEEPGSGIVHMRLFDAKWNHRGKQKPFGIRMEFAGESVTFEGEDPAQAGAAAETTADRMGIELAKGPLSTGMLAVALEVKESTIRGELIRSRDRFERDERGFIRLKPAADETPMSGDLPW